MQYTSYSVWINNLNVFFHILPLFSQFNLLLFWVIFGLRLDQTSDIRKWFMKHNDKGNANTSATKSANPSSLEKPSSATSKLEISVSILKLQFWCSCNLILSFQYNFKIFFGVNMQYWINAWTLMPNIIFCSRDFSMLSFWFEFLGKAKKERNKIN